MILMPETLTAENGAKAALIGEFHETFTHECSECEGSGLGPACRYSEGETRCELCDGTGELVERIPVDWTTIKEIYKRAVALLGQPQTNAIAEAVAAEREKNAKVCDEAAKTAGSVYSSTAHDPENRGADCAEEIARDCAEAIRSAAK